MQQIHRHHSNRSRPFGPKTRVITFIIMLCTAFMGILWNIAPTSELQVSGIKTVPLQPNPASWLTTAARITIDGDSGWELSDWVNGSGTYEDPYSLCNLSISAGGIGNCITIKNTQKYFKIVNCTLSYSQFSTFGVYYAGIYLQNAGNGTFFNNTCTGNQHGIYLDNARNVTLESNDCVGNAWDGIHLFGINCRNNSLITNNCSENGFDGISIGLSPNITLSGNTCSENGFAGIEIDSASEIVLSNNLLTSCSIVQSGSLAQLLTTSIYPNNQVNGLLVRVYTNQTQGLVVPADTGQAILLNCTSATIENHLDPGLYITLTIIALGTRNTESIASFLTITRWRITRAWKTRGMASSLTVMITLTN